MLIIHCCRGVHTMNVRYKFVKNLRCLTLSYCCILLLSIAGFLICSAVLKRLRQQQLDQFNLSHTTPATAGLSGNNALLDASLPLCSFHAFRNHLRRTSSLYLEGAGTWTSRTRPDGSRTLSTFRPSICRLEHGTWIPRAYLSHCIRRQNLTNIVLLGDSNAWRLYFVARQSLSASGHGRLRHGIQLPDGPCRMHYNAYNGLFLPNYFSAQLPKVAAAAAAGEAAGRSRRDIDSEASLSVQFLPMTGDYQALNTTLNSTTEGCWNGSNQTTTDTYTYQEFIFRQYFTAGATPDLVIHLSSSWEQSSLSGYASQVDRFVDLLRRHPLPSRTHLLVVSKPDECVRLKPAPWNETMYEDGKLTRTQWIDAANHILHSRLVPLFLGDEDKQQQQQQQLLLFPDIAQAMRPVIDEIATDGIHTNSFWYQTLWSLITQSVCNT